MKRFIGTKIIAVALTFVVGAVAVAAAERPFSASGSGVATFITDEAGNPIGANVVASGNATHLGSFTSSGQIHFTPDPNNPIIFHLSGEASFTAADCDKLNVVIEDGVLDITTGIATRKSRIIGCTGR